MLTYEDKEIEELELEELELEAEYDTDAGSFLGSIISFLMIMGMVTLVLLVPLFILRGCMEAYSTYDNQKINLLFNKNSELICKKTFDTQSYLVSKDKGWSVYQGYFKKDDKLIEMGDCKRQP